MFISKDMSFQDTLKLVIVSLTLLCGLLVIATWLQGPRVRLGVINTNRATLSANQRLQLQLNQNPGVVNSSHITINPRTSFTAASSGNTIILQFKQPLRAATKYEVKIRSADRRHVFGHSFTTQPTTIFYAVNDSTNGYVYKRPLDKDAPVRVFRGNKVTDFLTAKDKLIVHTQNVAGESTLLLQDLTDPKATPSSVILPEKGVITELRTAPDGHSFGFRFTAANLQAARLGNIGLFDLTSGKLRWVKGLDGQPIRSFNWQWSKDSKAILAQTYDLTVFIIQPERPPAPLGQFSDIKGLSWNNANLLATTMNRGILVKVDLKTAASHPLGAYNGIEAINAVPLNIQEGYVLQADYSKAEGSSQRLLTERDNKRQIFYSLDNRMAYIRSFILSNNDQYVAVEKNGNQLSGPVFDIVDTFTKEKVLTLPAVKVRFMQ